MATMEGAYRQTEDALFYGIDATTYARASVPGYPDDLTYSNPNDTVSRVIGKSIACRPSMSV
ncbi:MAG TPA: hypothetical protein VNW04_11175 [Puia sp.]|jgi:hypothetical protein|nr:hypothetical protein [Puia sp.]